MTRRPRTGSSTTGTLGRRVVRRTGATVVAAALGGLAAAVAVTVSGEVPAPVQDAGSAGRTAERPSRNLARVDEPTGGLVDRLLPADALTGPAPGRAWRVVHTELHEPRTLAGSCHRFPLVSVGAIRIAHRAYAVGPAASPRATVEHVVARFADTRTAWRAHEVLLAWQADCPETLADVPDVRVSRLREVGAAERYAVAWAPTASEARVREDVALVQVRSRVALVRVTAPAAEARTARETVTDAIRAAGGLLD